MDRFHTHLIELKNIVLYYTSLEKTIQIFFSKPWVTCGEILHTVVVVRLTTQVGCRCTSAASCVVFKHSLRVIQSLTDKTPKINVHVTKRTHKYIVARD